MMPNDDTANELAIIDRKRRLLHDEVMAEDPDGRKLIVQRARAEALASGLALVNRDLAAFGPAMLVLQLADALQVSPAPLAQYAYVVSGKLCWSSQGQLAIAKQSGKVLDYWWVMDDSSPPQWATCHLLLPPRPGQHEPREVVETVTMAMQKHAGWKSDQWSKAPQLMLRWRSASYALRLHVPDLALGVSTEEVRDEPAHIGEATMGPGPSLARLGEVADE
jgi:hypothetical protein